MKSIRRLLFAAWCCIIGWCTVFSRTPSANHRVELRLLWSYRNLFAGVPTARADVIQNIDNILFFIPFGFLLPVNSWKKALIAGFGFSFCIELAQYAGGLGLAELDDVICNTIGAVIGFWFMYLIKKWIMRDADEI